MANIDAYKLAGVDVEAGYEAVRLMKNDVARTRTPYVLSGLGGFGGLVELPEGYKKPVLVSGTDGVGTKLMIALMMDIHDTIGIDAVAMCVNDILCQGANPLYFLDYIACGKNKPSRIAQIVKGVAEGCVQGEMALVGGETAEMPDMYKEDDYDLAGFAVGVVEKDKIITGSKVRKGDVLVGLPSTGVHSNGFSLVRKILFKDLSLRVDTYIDELGKTLGEALLTPTKIYVKSLKEAIAKYNVHGLSHITGGGFYENIPRMIPEGMCANVYTDIITPLPIFDVIEKLGKIEKDAMYATFNMGIGLVAALAQEDVEGFVASIKEKGENPVIIGEIVTGDTKINLW